MANGKAKQAFLDALPETLKGIEHTGASDEVKEYGMAIRDAVIAAFEETAPVPPSRVRVQRCDTYLKPGQVRTTWEVVDDRLPGKNRIARSFDDEAKARDFARRIAPVAGGAYVFQAVDADEYFHDTDYEVVASAGLYGVVNGCGLTYDAANMTVDLAAGSTIHSGALTIVAAATDAYTLVADGSNERWAALCTTSAGAAALLSGDPAANGSSEPAKPEIGDRVLHGMAKIQAAQTIANNCELKLDKRIMVHQPIVEGPIIPYSSAGTGSGARQLNVNTTAAVGIVHLTNSITVTTLSFEVTAVGASGTCVFAIFSNDGQTRYINGTTGTISGTGDVNTTLGTSVTLCPGTYYVMICSVGTADVTVRTWSTELNAAATGLNELCGTVTVTAGTIPSTFDPDAGTTFAANAGLQVRFN